MNGAQKIDNLRLLVEFLTKQLENYDRASSNAHYTFALDENTEARKEFSKALVDNDSGRELAEKYDMHPNGKIGKYIDTLAATNLADLECEQFVPKSNMVVLIALSGVLFGEYECLNDQKEKFSNVERVALDMLGEDVDWVKENIVSALNILNAKQGYEMYPKVGHILRQRLDDYAFANVDPDDGDAYLKDDSELAQWCNNLGKHKRDVEREKYHMIRVLEHKTNTDFRILHESQWVLVRAFEMYNRDDYVRYNYSNDNAIRDMLNIVCAAQKMDDKYVIGRSMNLWANKVLESIDRSIAGNKERLKEADKQFKSVKRHTVNLYDKLRSRPQLIREIKKSQR
ncbi:MAG: hypothetical protein J6T57_01870 [Alphaproteobacteria bacterium]|nr:hypothetical protein [Alphaproteobacteria bacterium]